MTFAAVVFGSYVVGTGYTDGSTSPVGLAVYIKPTANIGNNPLGVGITYIDQSGNAPEVTTVTTSVPANTTSGTHIKIVLNTGDTGIEDITAITVTGGTAGDAFNLESWNEGAGKAFSIAPRTDANPAWEDTEPTKEIYHGEQSWMKGEQLDVTLSNALIGGTPADQNAVLTTEIIEPDYETECHQFGLLPASINQSNADKELYAIASAGAVAAVDANEQAARFKWKWGGSSYVDVGFYQLDFDLALNRGSLFTFEVLDKIGVVKLSKAANVGGWTASPAVNSYCGQETSYPASNSRDNNTGTEWKHLTNELHWIVYDFGSSIPVGGVKIYFGGLGSGWSVSVYISDNLADFGAKVIDGWGISGAANWYSQGFVPKTGRYMKVTIDPNTSDNSMSDFREIQYYALQHQTLVFKDFAWEMRLRASTSGTAAGIEYADMRNIRITRYKSSGSVTSNYPVSIPNIHNYDEVLLSSTLPAGTNVKIQLAFSDDGSTWSDYVGPDGTTGTYYTATGTPIVLPGGYTGYYYKWMAILESDGRDTPIFDTLTVWEFLNIVDNLIELQKQLSDWNPDPNPLMIAPLPFTRAYPRACPGYPAPPAGGDFVSDTVTGNELVGKIIAAIIRAYPRACAGYPAPPAGGSFVADPLSGRTATSRIILWIHSFSETVVGQVLSGYLRDQNENIILGFKVIITSSYSVGLDQMGTVNPATGFFQVFVKNTKYDNRYCLVELTGKAFSIAYSIYGTPAIIDGRATVVSPQDLHFYKPDQICGKSVVYVGSLVTY